MRDLHQLPKVRDSLSYLYVEQGRIDQKLNAVEHVNEQGRTMIPVASLNVLMLGPGTTITHAAVKTLADNGCLVAWTGEEGVRFYAQGTGETRRAYHLLHQARLAATANLRMEVVNRMYRYRFQEELEPTLSLEQIRGLEGVRVRAAYQNASRAYGVEWRGRKYDRGEWDNSDPVNRALSAANACLNAVCHAAIVAGGYSSALGFVHTGKQLSFVYDIADLYKVNLTVPIAFRLVAETTYKLEMRVRHACRDAFREQRILERILPDIDTLLNIPPDVLNAGQATDSDPALPTDLWNPEDE